MTKKIKTPATETSAVSKQPYYLQRAHIKDFRSIRDATAEFKPGLNIIIGANGSGKTNFLKCVESGIDTGSKEFIGGSQSSFYLSGSQLVSISYLKEYRQLDGRITNLYLSGDIFQTVVTIQADDSTVTGNSLGDIIQNHTVEIVNGFVELYGLQLTTIEHGVPKPYILFENAIDMIVGKSGWVRFSENKSFIPSSASAIRSALTWLIGLQRYNDEATTIKKITLSFEQLFSQWLDGLKNLLRKFSPVTDIKFKMPVQPYEVAAQDEVVFKDLLFEFKVDGKWLPFGALSSGTQRVLYLISEVSALNTLHLVNSSVAQLESRIILLEEPELGIHPDQLHKLLLFLRQQSGKHQIIITTHSPQVLDMLKEDELDRITICELDAKKGTRFRKLKKAQIAIAQKYMKNVGFLSDYWRYGSLEENN